MIGSTVSPRVRSTCPRAAATATRMASLVVAPQRWAAARSAVPSTWTTVIRRRGPVRCTSEQGVARGGRHPPPAVIAARSSRQDSRAEPSARTRRRQASRASCPAVGGSRGNPASTACSPLSRRADRMVRPPSPSASTWWTTSTKAAEPSDRPVTSENVHSGSSLDNGVVSTDMAVSRSACSSPGGRHATSRTCRHTSNWAWSTHTGPPQPSGVRCRRWRSLGTAGTRAATSARTRSRPRSLAGPSRSRTPNCSGTGPASMARKARSVLLARSTGAALIRATSLSGRSRATPESEPGPGPG